MNAKLSFTGRLTLGAIAILFIPLSGCLQGREDSVRAAQVGDGPHERILAQEKVQLEGLRFKPDGGTLRRNSRAVLDAAAEILRSEPDKKVYVDAYCDQANSKIVNLRLAQQRAETVKAYLEAQGISSDRMIARGFGAEQASNDSPHIRKQNSTVELIPFSSYPASRNLAYSAFGKAS
jgi:outer membrane protein OmpA-like peptidoglycan-associated protein